MIRKKIINNEIEKQIIIGMIVSTDFLKSIKKSFNHEFLKVEHYRKIAKWCLDYLNEFNKAPDRDIEKIYKIERQERRLNEDELDLIESSLESLSDQYEQKNFNHEYLSKHTREYFDKRATEILFRTGANYVDVGRYDDAKELLQKHKEITRITSGRFRPLSLEEINEYDPLHLGNKLLTLPGDIGRMIKPLERGWLMAVTAPEKRGKTWFLDEIGFQGLINNLKVAKFSFEMSKVQQQDRFYRRLTGTISPDDEIDDPHVKRFPIWDCLNNQDGSCDRSERQNDRKLLDKNGNKPEFHKNMKYKPCSICKGKWHNDSGYEYIAEYWFKEQGNLKVINNEIIKKKVIESPGSFVNRYGDNFIAKSYPAFSASMIDIKNELDDMEYTDNFIPDIVVIDYFDILRPDRKGHDTRAEINEIWMMGKNIADTRQILVVTADQGNKASRLKESMDEMDTTEDKRKDANLDVRIVLNQTPEEKEDKVMRVAVTYNRHRYFNRNRECMILQQLHLGQPLLDSYMIDFKKKKKKGD